MEVVQDELNGMKKREIPAGNYLLDFLFADIHRKFIH